MIISCTGKKPVYNNITGLTQGTTYNIIVENDGTLDLDSVKTKLIKVLRDIDMSLSIYNDSSVISRINRNEKVKADRYLTEVFNKSAEISQMTGGAFDITVGLLVKAWGFGPDAVKNFTESKRDSLMKLVGINKVKLSDGYLIKSNPSMFLDVNAIAQGYTVDIVCYLFDSLKIRSYLVEIGGEVRVKGKKGKDYWRIGIDKPEDYNFSPGADLQAVVKLENMSVSTSGNYRKFYVENGIKYSHTIDPQTGYPVKHQLLSASIFANDCTTADAFATACMVLGKDGAINLINKYNFLQGYLIYSDEDGNFKTWISESLKKSISKN